MAKKKKGEKKRGPKGGIKHQPGRGHDSKSKRAKTRRFQNRSARKRREMEERAREEWAKWDQLPDEAKKLYGDDARPKLPRPQDET